MHMRKHKVSLSWSSAAVRDEETLQTQHQLQPYSDNDINVHYSLCHIFIFIVG